MLDDMENYMVNFIDLRDSGVSSGIALLNIVLRMSMHATNNYQDVALLDNTTTYTILQDPLFFNFSVNQTKAWQTYQMHTVAGR